MDRSAKLKATLIQNEDNEWFLELESNEKSDRIFCDFLKDTSLTDDTLRVLIPHDSNVYNHQTQMVFKVSAGPDLKVVKKGVETLSNWLLKHS